MKVNAIRCKKCNTIVYSRCTHDMRWCDCKSCAIDGGFEYVRIAGNQGTYETIDVEIGDVSKGQLYNDWNCRKDRYGKLKDI